MNVETMRQLRLAAGDHVIIKQKQNDNSTTVALTATATKGSIAIAWPSIAVPENHIQLSSVSRLNADVAVGDPVLIAPLSATIHEASQITLTALCQMSFLSSQMFTMFTKEIMAEIKYVLLDNLIEFPYNGKPQRFKVTGILWSRQDVNHGNIANISSQVSAIGPSTVVKILPFVATPTSAISSLLSTSSTSLPADSIPNPDSSKPLSAHASASLLEVHTDGSYDNIGGLGPQIRTVREMVEIPLKNPEIFTQFGLRPPKGVLLHGPPGTGKTLIARTVAKATGAFLTIINGPEIISKFYGETEAKLRSIFDQAAENSPSIIFIDEIDALCPKRDEAASEMEKRVVATLLTLMDGVADKPSSPLDSNQQQQQQLPPRVVVMGATNRPNALDEALRRPGRFDREVEIGIPDAKARAEILSAILKTIPNDLSSEQVNHLASISHGYVGADLAAVCREAGLKTIKRLVFGTSSDTTDAAMLTALRVSAEDMRLALTDVRPSAMREIMIEVPKVLWTDIGGQEEIKQKLKESVEWPLQHPEAFLRLGIRPPKGILLYGPPGCSKTLMAKALATQAGLNFIAVKGPELFSKWVGESEKAVREVFRKARAASPSIVFFDEIDALTVKRGGDDGGSSVSDRVLSQLLNELDGIEPLVNVTVVAATNRPDIMDAALMRPGRIDRILYVSPPDYQSRYEILKMQIKGRSGKPKMTCLPDVDLDQLAKATEGCSGAEVVNLCQEAAMKAMEESLEIEAVGQKHFEQALALLVKRITPEMIKFYDDFRVKSGLKSV